MGYNILGLNFSHNGSACILSDGKIVYFLEEERISRLKYDYFPTKLLEILSKSYNIDEIVIAGLSYFPFNVKENYLKNVIRKYFKSQPITSLLDYHHLTHASCSFYNSGFKEGLSIVIDGSGTLLKEKNTTKFETESIYKFSYNKLPIQFFKNYQLTKNPTDKSPPLSKSYEVVSEYLGFSFLEAGKTMGLSSYGKFNPNIPNLIIKGKGNPSLFKSISPKRGWAKIKRKFHFLFDSLELKRDIAYKIQQETQKYVGDLIEEQLQKTDLKQVCCSGGYFLNCVANYYLTKRFPKVEFYFEPISSDAGTSIGAAKLAWHQKTQDKTRRPQKTLYYGPKYTKEQILEGIQKYLD